MKDLDIGGVHHTEIWPIRKRIPISIIGGFSWIFLFISIMGKVNDIWLWQLSLIAGIMVVASEIIYSELWRQAQNEYIITEYLNRLEQEKQHNKRIKITELEQKNSVI